MKTLSRSFTLLTLILLLITALAQETFAQCVNCKASGGGVARRLASDGGCKYATVGSGEKDCVVSIPCSRGVSCAQGRLSQASQERASLKLDDSTIRQIGQSHPRFAAMLASINKAGGLKSWMQVHQMAAPIYVSDVENWLKPDNEAQDFFREYSKRQVPDAETPVYEFTLQATDDEHAILQGKVIKGFDGDPAATNLEVELVKGKVVNWKLY